MNLCCNLSTVIIYVDTWWTLLELFHVLFYQVKKDSATYSETPVEISGSDDAIKKAKELIEQIISPQSSIISSMGGTCYKFLKLHCCYIKLTLGESLLCIEQHAKKAVSDSPGASGFDIGILLHKPSQFLTVVWGSSVHVSSIWSGILPGSKLQPTMIPSYPGLPQWFSTMFFLACLFFHLPCGTQTIT